MTRRPVGVVRGGKARHDGVDRRRGPPVKAADPVFAHLAPLPGASFRTTGCPTPLCSASSATPGPYATEPVSCRGALRSETVQRTPDSLRSPIQHMGVDHGCSYVLMAQQLLDRANVIAIFEQMSRKGMPEGVRRHSLGQSSTTSSGPNGSLDRGFVKVVAPPLTRVLMPVGARRRKGPLPTPITARFGILALQGSRKLHPAGPRSHVTTVLPSCYL